jgi:hypothetical protein
VAGEVQRPTVSPPRGGGAADLLLTAIFHCALHAEAVLSVVVLTRMFTRLAVICLVLTELKVWKIVAFFNETGLPRPCG